MMEKKESKPQTLGADPYCIPLKSFADEHGISDAYAAHLAHKERIEGPNGEPGARKRGRDWFCLPGSRYSYHPLGGRRAGAGRKKAVLAAPAGLGRPGGARKRKR